MLGLRGLEEGLAGTNGTGVVRVSVEGIGSRQVGGGARNAVETTPCNRWHTRDLLGKRSHTRVASEWGQKKDTERQTDREHLIWWGLYVAFGI